MDGKYKGARERINIYVYAHLRFRSPPTMLILIRIGSVKRMRRSTSTNAIIDENIT